MEGEKLKGKKCVVTGGAGFIGSHLVNGLLKVGAEVRVIDDLRSGRRERIPKDATFYETDISEGDLEKCFDGVDIVFHLAAIPGVPVSIKDPTGTHTVNVDGTHTVLEAARTHGVKRVVFSSSAAVYGAQDTSVFVETMELSPLSPYALHKIIGEYMMKTWAPVYGVETVSLRYFNVYGSGMNPEGPYAAVIGKFLDSKAKGEPLPITGDGTNTRDFVHVADVVRANLLAASSDRVGKGEVVNVGTGFGTSINEVAKLIGGEIKYTEPRLEIQHAVADITRAKKILNYKPSVSFKNGLDKLL